MSRAESRSPRPAGRILRLLPLLLLAPPALLCGLANWARPLHSLHLYRMAGDFADVAHPTDSTVLMEYRRVGILDGAGNHCDYIAGQQRRSSLSADALRSFYAHDAALHVHIPGQRGEDNYAPDVIRHGTPDWPEGSYAVYYYDGSNPPVGDMRCI